MNSNLFCGDFPAAFQLAGIRQHDVSSQSEASQTSIHDKGIFISHTYSRPTFLSDLGSFFLLQSVLYPLFTFQEEDSRNGHRPSQVSFHVQQPPL